MALHRLETASLGPGVHVGNQVWEGDVTGVWGFFLKKKPPKQKTSKKKLSGGASRARLTLSPVQDGQGREPGGIFVRVFRSRSQRSAQAPGLEGGTGQRPVRGLRRWEAGQDLAQRQRRAGTGEGWSAHSWGKAELGGGGRLLGGGACLRRERPWEPCSPLLCAQRPEAAFLAGCSGGVVVHPTKTVVAAGARAFITLEGQAAGQSVHASASGRDLRQRLVA